MLHFGADTIYGLFEFPGRLFWYTLCMAGRVRLVSKPLIYLKFLDEFSRYHRSPRYDSVLLTPILWDQLLLIGPCHTWVPCHLVRGANWVGDALLQHLVPCFLLLWWAAVLLPAAQLYGKSWRENELMNCVIAARCKSGAEGDQQSLSAQCWPSHHLFVFSLALSLSLYNWAVCPQIWLTWNNLFTAAFWRCEDAPCTGISPPNNPKSCGRWRPVLWPKESRAAGAINYHRSHFCYID